MFAHTVGGIDDDAIDQELRAVPREGPGYADSTRPLTGLGSPARLADFYAEKTGREFPTDPWAMLCEAINAVFLSWNSERAITYRKHHKIDGLLGTAVNVQMMCPSEVSGVMFTANPVNQAGEIIIESAYGLGEAIVLGKVTPDRFVLDKNSLAAKESVISRKEKRVATLAENGQGQSGAIDSASLAPEQVHALAELGKRVEAYFRTSVRHRMGAVRAANSFSCKRGRSSSSRRRLASIRPSARRSVRRRSPR